jgi:outer membrane protein insertion porin family
MRSENFSGQMMKKARSNIFPSAAFSAVCKNTLNCFLATILLMFSACTAMKYVPDNEVLYTGADLKLVPTGKIRAKKRVKELMDQNVSPKPNGSILGMRPGLWFYYVAGDPKKKGFRSFIKNKLGHPPVYMRDVDPERTTNLIKGHLINNGFFQARVEFKSQIEKKKGRMIYTAYVHRPYRLRKIDYPENDTLFANIDSIRNESYLKVRQRYNLERMQAEQERIEESLENYGYFFFDDRHLLFEADSTVGEKQVDLTLTLEKGVPPKATRIYHLGAISIFPDYTLTDDSLIRATDTLKIDGYNYIDRQKNYRPKIITKVINLKEGNTYRRIDREYTLQHLMSLGSFKFVDIKFREDRRDSTRLNTSIYLTPHLKKSIRADLQATSKSNNFVGPGLSIKFTNRNFLGGSERFDITASTGYEVQISRKIPEPLNAFEFGIESGLSVPRFIAPVDIHYPSRKFLPTTDFKLGFRLQQRIGYFRLNSFTLNYGYTWRENTLKTHELFPVDVNYMKLGKTSEDFNTMITNNPFLARSLEDQFIMGARYSYTLNTQVNEQRQEKYKEQRFERSNFFFNAKLESAGNLVHLLRGGQFKSNVEQDSTNKIFGSAYAQFIRGESDFRYYFRFDEKNMLASRLVIGTGYAYGNSITMPYIRQFSTGGSNSVRSFPARSIGPGTYDVRTDTQPGSERTKIFLDQRGDLKLELSTELRFDITKVLKGAVFMDAGNIWLWNEDVDRPGSQFNRGTFLKELAAGAGAGIRFDFNFFVLRLDLAFPIRKPYLPEGERWVLDEMDFGSSSWRSDNLILNIAIGYPF